MKEISKPLHRISTRELLESSSSSSNNNNNNNNKYNTFLSMQLFPLIITNK